MYQGSTVSKIINFPVSCLLFINPGTTKVGQFDPPSVFPNFLQNLMEFSGKKSEKNHEYLLF